MSSVLDLEAAGARTAGEASSPDSPTRPELISTPAAAALMGLSEATLRNYAWLNSLSAEARADRKLQEPPAGLPVPTRKSGRLFWPLPAVMKFADQKSKQAE